MPDDDVPVVVVTAPGSDCGKTTVIEAVVSTLAARGVRVGYVKRAHHGVDPDTPGKDTHRVRAAGAAVTVLASPDATAVFLPPRGRAPVSLAAFAAAQAPLDLVLVEGGRDCTTLPRIVVLPDGAALDATPAAPLLAVVGRGVHVPAGVRVVDPDDAEALADLLPHRTP